MKRKNPIDRVWFYTKKEPDVPKRIEKEEVSYQNANKMNYSDCNLLN